jgi:predicted nuclease of predicted toxin-antitoxin system
MSLQILIDMNLPPAWVDALSEHGWPAEHWSTIGKPNASDVEIMGWARSNGYVVFTHDLDFGTMLALTQAAGPSVLQVRGQNVLPDQLSSVVLSALKQHESDLVNGALVVVEASKTRVRVLPI